MGPAITLILGGSVVMAASLVLKPGSARDVHGQRTGVAVTSLVVLALAAILELLRTVPVELGQGLFRFDQTALASERLALLGGLILILMSWSTQKTTTRYRSLSNSIWTYVRHLGGLFLHGSILPVICS